MKGKILALLIAVLFLTIEFSGCLEDNKDKSGDNRRNYKINHIGSQSIDVGIWSKTYGTARLDEGYYVQQTLDDGFIITGMLSDRICCIKTDLSGDIEWSNSYSKGKGKSVQQTTDGGYIITGSRAVIKIYNNGTEEWNYTFGNIEFGPSTGNSILEIDNDGYIVVGEIMNQKAFEFYILLVKIDESGNEEWNYTFGKPWDMNQGYCVLQINNGGYLIIGRTDSYGFGNLDVFLIKTDKHGNEQWNKTYGNINDECGYCIQETSDGGYIITGYGNSYGEQGVLLLKVDENGNETWSKIFVRGDHASGKSVRQTSDDGYIITGYFGTYETGNDDLWVIKTDENGIEQWNKSYGGLEWDYGESIEQTTDGNFIIVGWTQSYGTGLRDIWLIKISNEQSDQ